MSNSQQCPKNVVNFGHNDSETKKNLIEKGTFKNPNDALPTLSLPGKGN